MNTVTLFSYRTSMGCHVYGHISSTEDGPHEHVTLATEPPPVLMTDRTRTFVDRGAKEWRT